VKRTIQVCLGEEARPIGLLSVTAYFRIGAHRAKEILRQVGGVVGDWRKTGRNLGMSDRELEQFADAFEHSEREAARKASR